MIRSILAVIAGYFAWTALWLVGGIALLAAFSIDPAAESISSVGYLGGALVLSIACSLLGGFICGKITQSKTIAVWVLGTLLLLTGIAVQASAWSVMPVWYHLTFLLLLEPVTYLGYWLAVRKSLPKRRW